MRHLGGKRETDIQEESLLYSEKPNRQGGGISKSLKCGGCKNDTTVEGQVSLVSHSSCKDPRDSIHSCWFILKMYIALIEILLEHLFFKHSKPGQQTKINRLISKRISNKGKIGPPTHLNGQAGLYSNK